MKKYILLVLIFVLCFYSIASAEYTNEWKNGNTLIPDYRCISCLGTAVRISKPQAHFSIKNLTTSGVVDSYTGKDCNKPIPVITATVGDIISFSDLSLSAGKIKAWDFQFYGAEGNGGNVYTNNPLTGKNIKLTKAGTTTFYLAVLSDEEVINDVLPWSDNGNHQTVGPKTVSFPNGVYWYFTAITVKTSAAPTPAKKLTATPTPTPRPAKASAPAAQSANITASASVYYVSDPGVNSIKSGYGFRLEVDTDVVVSPKPGTEDPKPTGAKKATAYFLGKAYPMEVKSSSGTKVSFYLPKNPDSVTNARKIYIPVETADGTYDIAIYLEASYNGEPVSKTIHKSITVKGNYFEDDYTAPKD